MRNSMRGPLRTIIICLTLLMLTFFMNSCDKENIMRAKDAYEEETHEDDHVEDQEWTFLLYDNADCGNVYSLLDDFAELVWSGEHVNYLVLVDESAGPAKMWFIDEDHKKVLLEDMGEINMASPETLYDFLNYAKTNYPARRYILAMGGAGHTWESAGYDGTSGSSDCFLLDEMREALIDAGGVDIVFFCGMSNMGCIEVAYELRDCTDFYIGSENWINYLAWRSPLQSICYKLHGEPGISNQELAEKIIESLGEYAGARWWTRTLAMSAVRMDSIVPLKEAVEVLAQDYFLNDKQEFVSHVNSIMDDITIFSRGTVDVYEFAEKLLTVEEDQELRTMLENVKDRLQSAVLSECHAPSVPNAHGLTIYLPDVPDVPFNYRYVAEEYGLDFIIETYWDELIRAYVDGR